ncbi:MAG: 16S rRNA (cytidine(1402)-2'-O)-methyltransferase [Ignavibacteria bacterium GWB2_35_12]|nr:MAG: 16S rRNA (cytidine(1402)-2'-O)-methyltransferase [Ignavibacteria bacterium GWA2_35_8]OGU40785.1 MAG: 16S rRNA (cytidine(1402)-2'-O)-methyltransferase [Ignavibacteria bacterium GWB2_35_12]OGU94147.1 MAG: 16S rRNA (cytidine(1402)-2'-O)-methyltransferase [Ignavibacteria bacterium RIFOXYA2_FULL_35_10]OGV23743.1 MAG: 16S rRNA (cytidine(1402)-2'-O)-methyltransferase [Ignavibacteria bacterium RIFOXYC2_FULL_35_21]
MGVGNWELGIGKIETGLYIVPTPIGNLDDITIRAVKILSSADIIACEDTRHTGTMLKILNIPHKKLESYHEHNEESKSAFLVNEILSGKSVALVTDAGTPGISDPGYRIIKKAIENNIKIVSLPGPTAFIPALVASGLPVNEFHFYGFLPAKKGRKTFLQEVASQKATSILYESPYKILKLIDELIEHCGSQRQVCIAREISKVYEEYIRGTLEECKQKLQSKTSIKGEFVVVIEGNR